MTRFRELWMLAALVPTLVWASPPVNLAGDVDKALPRERPLTQDDLVYTDNVKPDDAILHEAGHILYDVIGRSLPNRQGKPIHKFLANDLVRVLKDSKDGHWAAVETYGIVKNQGRKQAWVPKSAVKPPLPPEAPAPAAGAAPPNAAPAMEGVSADPAGLTPGAVPPPAGANPAQGF